MATIYLHIGMPKTGTTSIQKFLSDNEKVLEQHGICFPDFGLRYSRVGERRNGHFLSKIKISNSGDFMENAAYANYQTVLTQLSKLSQSYDRIILSDEGLWRNKGDSPAFWKKFKGDLGEKGLSLRVLVYLRRQDNFVQSIYRQKIKRFKTNLSFHSFLEDFNEVYPLDYYSYMNMLSDCIGRENLIIRVYEKEQYQGEAHDLFSDYLNIFDLSLSDGFEIKEQACNLSLDDTRLELRRALSPLPKPYKDKVLMNALYSFPEDEPSPEGSIKTSFFKPGEQSAYLNNFSESNARLAKEFLGREDGALFYSNKGMDDPEYSVDTEALIAETIFLYGRSVQLLEEEVKALREDVLFYRLKRKLRHIFRKEK